MALDRILFSGSYRKTPLAGLVGLIGEGGQIKGALCINWVPLGTFFAGGQALVRNIPQGTLAGISNNPRPLCIGWCTQKLVSACRIIDCAVTLWLLTVRCRT